MSKSCNRCKCVKAKYKTSCGDCGKLKLKIPEARAIGTARSVATQAVTSVSTTVLQLTSGSFNFTSATYCCNGCNSYSPNGNVICLNCGGIFTVTAFLYLDTAPGSATVFLALDVNSQQVLVYPLTGDGVTISFSTNLNLCATDRLQFRIYSVGSYTGNVTTGNVSAVKVSERISCCN